MSPGPTGAPAMRLFRIFGIDLRADLSVLVIFALVLFSLGTGPLAAWHPAWSPGLRWGVATCLAVLFFLSLVAHEMAHSLTAKAFGIEVPRITLFVFGGVSEMEREPDAPGVELLVAIAGPATSFAIAFVCIAAFWLSVGPDFGNAALEDPASAAASLGPVPTMLAWLGPINGMLGLFNLVPGFPLDGGRVLRAALWKVTGDLERATRWASNAGRGFGWALMALGALQVLSGSFQGFWMVLIGWFLQHAARSTYAQLLLRQALEGLVVRDLMRTRFETVPAGLTVTRFIEEYLLHSAQYVWPVVDGDALVGLVSFDAIRELPVERRAETRVGDLAESVDDPIGPDLGGREALEHLARTRQDPLAVVQDGRIVGLLHGADIGRWLAVRSLDHT